MRFSYAIVVALACIACNPKSLKPGRCRANADCTGMNEFCNNMYTCERKDASAPTDASDARDASDGADARDGGDADVPFRCKGANDCSDGGANVCELDAGMCVECLTSGDCAARTNTPICKARMCVGCKTDGECEAAPGICMADGRCAMSGEVIFVESSAAGCTMADGSTTRPYCTPTDGVAQLSTTKDVIVIRGPVNGPMSLTGTLVAALIVGRQNNVGEPGQIVTAVGNGIFVSGHDFLVRDLRIVGGGSSTSKGILVTGSAANVTLSNVEVNLTTGLGIQADAGAGLAMDRCIVTNNSVGGLLINGAGYDIQNSIFAGNGYGMKFNAAANPTGSRLSFVTVVGNTGNAVTCDSTNMRMISDSIVVGFNDSCTLVNSFTATQAFRSSPAYHLTVPIGCPGTPASPLPTHDIDNDPRPQPLDCGADQFVQ